MAVVYKCVHAHEAGSHMIRVPRKSIQNNEYFEIINILYRKFCHLGRILTSEREQFVFPQFRHD